MFANLMANEDEGEMSPLRKGRFQSLNDIPENQEKDSTGFRNLIESS